MHLFAVRFVDESSGGLPVERLVFEQRRGEAVELPTVLGERLADPVRAMREADIGG